MKPKNTSQPQPNELDPLIDAAIEIINELKRAKNEQAEAEITKRRNEAVATVIQALDKHNPASTSATVVASVLGTAADIAERNGKGSLYREIASGKFLLDCLSFAAKHKFRNA